MISLTEKERMALLILFKDFSAYHNSNTLGEALGISRVGAMKLLKRLEKESLVVSQPIGKAVVYKPKLENDYACELISFLLADEANRFKRWKEEFKGLFKKGRMVMIFGSAIRNYEKANDIDILIATSVNDMRDINAALREKSGILPKRLHAIKLTVNELEANVKRKEAAVIEIIRTDIILYGQDEYVEVLKNVTGS